MRATRRFTILRFAGLLLIALAAGGAGFAVPWLWIRVGLMFVLCVLGLVGAAAAGDR